jgi:hypothetical protein
MNRQKAVIFVAGVATGVYGGFFYIQQSLQSELNKLFKK